MSNSSLPPLKDLDPTIKKDENTNENENEHKSLTTVNILRYIDLFAVEERPENALGGIVTLATLGLGIAYAIILLLQMLDSELQVGNDLKWSPQYEYPINIKCLSSAGCLVSNNNWEDLSSTTCFHLDPNEEIETYISYFDHPKYGLSIISNEYGNEYNYTEIIAVKSETFMPWMDEADKDGTFIMWNGIIAGTTYLNMVTTRNLTLKNSGRHRREYFSLQVDFNGELLQDSTTACTATDYSYSSTTYDSLAVYHNWTTSSDLRQVRLRLQASYNHITVSNPSSLWAWFGTSRYIY